VQHSKGKVMQMYVGITSANKKHELAHTQRRLFSVEVMTNGK
jgi:hypothetical protein